MNIQLINNRKIYRPNKSLAPSEKSLNVHISINQFSINELLQQNIFVIYQIFVFYEKKVQKKLVIILNYFK